jgi:hypothetical protein
MKTYLPIIRPEIEYGNYGMKKANFFIVCLFALAAVLAVGWVVWPVIF